MMWGISEMVNASSFQVFANVLSTPVKLNSGDYRSSRNKEKSIF